MNDGDWETPCPAVDQAAATADGAAFIGHCECWYDGEPCCRCGAPEMSEAERIEQGCEL